VPFILISADEGMRIVLGSKIRVGLT